jgi:hypothetical protein
MYFGGIQFILKYRENLQTVQIIEFLNLNLNWLSEHQCIDLSHNIEKSYSSQISLFHERFSLEISTYSRSSVPLGDWLRSPCIPKSSDAQVPHMQWCNRCIELLHIHLCTLNHL